MTRLLLFLAVLLPCLPCSAATKTFPLLNSFGNLQFPIQLVTTNPWGAYSVTRRLSSAYTGNAFRVRRSSDGTDLDIGFINGNLTDTNSLVSFVGSDTGYLTILYDQSGNGHPLNSTGSPSGTQTNVCARLILNGVMQRDILSRITADFSGNVTNAIFTSSSINTNLPVTYLTVIQPTAYNTTANRSICNMGTADWSTVNQLAFGMLSSDDFAIANSNSGAPFLNGGLFCTNVQYLATCYFDTGTSSSIQLYTQTATTGNAGTLIVATPAIGGGSSGADNNCADFKWSEWFIYTNALSAANTLSLQQNITNFYASVLGATCPNSSLNTSLISYWKMDETSGTRIDARGANDLTDNFTVTSGSGIIVNAGQYTAANTEYLSHADNTSLSTGDIDYSITCWVNMDTKGVAPTAIAKADGSPNNEYILRYLQSADRFQWFVSNNGSSLTLAQADNFGSPSTNTWYFIVAWHDSVNNLIGIQVNNGTANTTATSAGSFDSNSAFIVGRFAAANYWDGRVDEVGFWKKVLSTQEKTDLYNSGAGKTCCPFTP